ncbi:ABC transporter ATP-binding protein [Sphingobacterium detergens]|uniref:ABC-type multidrug transport system fused ATPase/permease subunit n=1 Tax=Sphingobacterium detergens TaxID=1145106 RepID=A0A420ALU0_SPHD1|nr:ABC transporter ATP-binding protein [Sphingobacterium detergens]RKE45420.1 ABC-type multidrug transport system fused ATPase/permease subunit [Sphingobacterium detergens]
MNNNSLKQHARWAWSVSDGYRGRLLLYFVLELICIGLSLIFVYLSKKAVDVATSPGVLSLKWLLIGIIGSITLNVAIKGYSGRLLERVKLMLTLQLQRTMLDAQMLSVWKLIKNWHTGDIQIRIQTDCEEVANTIANMVLSFVLTIIQLLASVGFLWYMDPMLALMILAISPLFVFSKIYFRRMRKLSKEVKEEESNFSKVLQENLRFRLLIRAMGIFPKRRAKLTASQQQLFLLKMRQINFSTYTQGAMKVAMNAGYLVAFIWGVYRLQSGQITFGTMTAFLQLVARIQTPILALIAYIPGFVRFRVSADRLLELQEGEIEPQVKQERLNKTEELRITDLSFRYEDKWVLQQLNLSLKVGEPTAIIGPSGKGKTTLIRLLLSLLKAEKGDITLVDIDGERSLEAKHRVNFAYIPQGNSLFSGTIRENLLLHVKEDGVLDIEQALWLACAEFVFDFPDGVDTLVGESGMGLSEGQAQRIAIARALMHDGDIWLFDEVTSALDRTTSDMLTQRLLEYGKHKICLFVTHDLHLADKCQHRIYLD